jgi:hypothetical protein
MVGSFMFSLGAYVNALSIFEAPKMFRKHLVIVTSSYMFGGLLFIAGTMGYVEAFEPNLELRWCATWFYLVGCLFYVTGSFLSFVSTVAGHQLRWERIQDSEKDKQKRLARLIGRATSALPRAFKASTWKRKRRRPAHQTYEDDGEVPKLSDDAEITDDLEEGPDEMQNDEFDLEAVERTVSEHLASELAAALQDEEEEEENLFDAFWRAVGDGPGASVLGLGDAADRATAPKDIPRSASSPAGRAIGVLEKDNIGLVDARES